MPADLEDLEAAIGYQFGNREILHRAVTHSSHAHERSEVEHNEQLEFLGDAVLGFLISEELVRRFPDLREGKLSPLKSHLVSATHLHRVARELDLGLYLHLGRSEELGGGRSKKTLLVDSLEAIMAAMYLDGGIDVVREFVRSRVIPDGVENIEQGLAPGFIDYKGALQELARSRKLAQPRYVTLNESGPDHSRIFTVEVRVGPGITAQGQGSSKKAAGQRAARKAYEQLSKPPAKEPAHGRPAPA